MCPSGTLGLGGARHSVTVHSWSMGVGTVDTDSGSATWPLPSKASNAHPEVWALGTGQGPQRDPLGKEKAQDYEPVGDQDSTGRRHWSPGLSTEGAQSKALGERVWILQCGLPLRPPLLLTPRALLHPPSTEAFQSLSRLHFGSLHSWVEAQQLRIPP